MCLGWIKTYPDVAPPERVGSVFPLPPPVSASAPSSSISFSLSLKSTLKRQWERYVYLNEKKFSSSISAQLSFFKQFKISIFKRNPNEISLGSIFSLPSKNYRFQNLLKRIIFKWILILLPFMCVCVTRIL